MTIRGEQAKVEIDAEYVPINASNAVSNVSNIKSTIQCSCQCMLNEMCLTATYYADLRMCRLFSADSSQGNIYGRANARVIRFIDRGKKQISTYLVEKILGRSFVSNTFAF
jgi:hypothetical protein